MKDLTTEMTDEEMNDRIVRQLVDIQRNTKVIRNLVYIFGIVLCLGLFILVTLNLCYSR
jgi:uncharacterized membrane protein